MLRPDLEGFPRWVWYRAVARVAGTTAGAGALRVGLLRRVALPGAGVFFFLLAAAFLGAVFLDFFFFRTPAFVVLRGGSGFSSMSL